MIEKLIENYKDKIEDNIDEYNNFIDVSKAVAYREILQDLEELKKIVREELYNSDCTVAEYNGACERLGVDIV